MTWSPAREADDPTSVELPNGDLLIGDFEQRDHGRMRAWGWQFEGDAFSRPFEQGTRRLRGRVGHHVGNWFLTSLAERPEARGAITSPEFQIQRPRIEFLFSGGQRPGTRQGAD